uniref:Uncharacterized protein n=1 Tax=Avena sativa TaxID=4498 RepID=A0ACD5XMA5_AVESA
MASAGLKRQRCSYTAPTARKRPETIGSPSQATDWSSLPLDIAGIVAERLLAEDVTDYMCFRAVCSHWRAAATSPCDPTLQETRFRPRGWVALCDGDGVRPADACEITFFHTSTGRRLLVRLTELENHRIVGFTDGLLILLNKATTVLRVLHPFTRAFVDLPPLAPIFRNLAKPMESRAWMKAAVCWAPASIAVVAWFPIAPVVIYADPGKPHWSVIHLGLDLCAALPFQGRLFGVRKGTGELVQVYPQCPQYPVVARVPITFGCPTLCRHHLVELGPHMLLAVQHRRVRRSEGWQPFAFALFLVNVRRRVLVPFGGLGDRALFLGKDRCLCVSAGKLPSISANSIYFAVPNHDPVVLHSLSSGTFERTSTFALIHDLKDRIRPSVRPFTLADHLMTYCHHFEWSKGLMFHEYYIIPFSWKNLWGEIMLQDCEIRLPGLGQEKAVGSLMSKKYNLISPKITGVTFALQWTNSGAVPKMLVLQ